MTRLYVAMQDELLSFTGSGGRWQVEHHLAGVDVQAVAIDPLRQELVYCATYGRGVWRSQDAGITWQMSGEGIPFAEVTAVAVSRTERVGGHGAVWVGTEPSALFLSEDGGTRWVERPGLRSLPSSSTWSYPPRPWTHHVRWITPDAVRAGRVFVSIEAGGVMRSLDVGLTWEDRRPDGPLDAHTVCSHRLAPDRLYAAAGDGLASPGRGYEESRDGGSTWHRMGNGLNHHYLWGLAVDPGDPERVVVSAAHGPEQAHNLMAAESTIYRLEEGSGWQEAYTGLPDSRGTLVSAIAVNDAEPGVFYLANNWGLFCSGDGGLAWAALPVPWPERSRSQRPQGMAIGS